MNNVTELDKPQTPLTGARKGDLIYTDQGVWVNIKTGATVGPEPAPQPAMILRGFPSSTLVLDEDGDLCMIAELHSESRLLVRFSDGRAFALSEVELGGRRVRGVTIKSP